MINLTAGQAIACDLIALLGAAVIIAAAVVF
jgi:hypothetical protein